MFESCAQRFEGLIEASPGHLVQYCTPFSVKQNASPRRSDLALFNEHETLPARWWAVITFESIDLPVESIRFFKIEAVQCVKLAFGIAFSRELFEQRDRICRPEENA